MNFVRSLVRVTQKAWPIAILIFLALSAASVPRTIKLFKTISTDPADLLPSEHPNVQSLFGIRAKLEKGIRTSIVFESDDPEATLRFLGDVTDALRKESFVGRVQDKKAGYEFFDKHKMYLISLEDLKEIRRRIDRRIQKEKLGGLYVDFEDAGGNELDFKDLEEKYGVDRSGGSLKSPYNVSADGKIYSIFVESPPGDTGLSAASRFQDRMETFVEGLQPQKYHPTMKVYFSGATKVLEYRALLKDLKKVGLISGILLFLPLLFRFRNPIHVGIVFLPLLIGMPISFAAASFFVAKLNVSTSFLFAILGGLGIENGIHIFSRYYEERTSGMEREEALVEIYAHTGRSILTSVASVAVTFLLLTLNDFRGFSEFGLIAGLGLWVIFVVYFGAMPSLLILFEKIKLLKFRTGGGEPEFNLNVKPAFLKAALAVFALFSLFSFFVTPKVGFEYDSKKTRAEIPKVVEAKKKQRLTATRVNNPAAIVIQSPSEAPALKQAVAEKIEAEKKATGETTLEGSLVYADVAPADLEEKKAVMGEILALLEDHTIVLVKGEKRGDIDRFKKELAEAEPFSESDIPVELKDLFRGKPEVPGEVFYINPKPKLELDDGRIAMKFAEEIGTLKTANGVYHPSSDGVVYGMVLKTMLNDSKKVLAISLLSVAFFVFVDFRSARKTFIVMTSIVVGVFWLLGICWMAGLKLNFYNMIIVPAVMGMSIDNSIHVFHRYEELGPGSLPKVLGTTGLSALIASLTNASGFFGLLFCLHKGLYSIGLLAVIGVGTCLLSTLVFLPALLQFLENFRNRKVAD